MSAVVLVFGRRLSRRVEAPVIPASENQHINGLSPKQIEYNSIQMEVWFNGQKSGVCSNPHSRK
jgi:hypothetical protein